jgi:hypothetical protein
MFGIPNPQKLLQPWRNLQHFTEELYAMLADGSGKTPASASAPGPQPAGIGPANKLARARAPEVTPSRPAAVAKSADTPRPAQADSRAERPEPTRRRDRTDASLEPERLPQPAIHVAGPARVTVASPLGIPAASLRRVPYSSIPDGVPEIASHHRQDWITIEPVKFPATDTEWSPGDSPNTHFQLFVGQVVSGSGDTYQVQLFSQGPFGGGTNNTVEVKIPTIDPDETIDPGTWLYGIYQFVDPTGLKIYTAQPAVWLE